MEQLEDLKSISPKEIAQTPLAYALYVVVFVLTTVIIAQRIDFKNDAENCMMEKQELRKQVKQERREKDEVFKAYLVQKGVVEQIQQTVDSAAIVDYKQKRK